MPWPFLMRNCENMSAGVEMASNLSSESWGFLPRAHLLLQHEPEGVAVEASHGSGRDVAQQRAQKKQKKMEKVKRVLVLSR